MVLGEIVWNEGTLAIAMIFGVPIVAVIAGAWVKIETSKSENDLKRSMVQRGMSADEMERILGMRPPKK